MRALQVCFLLVALSGLSVAATTRQLSVPTAGSAGERVAALWNQTRPLVAADAQQTLSDSQAMDLGAPMIAAWSKLQSSLGGKARGQTHAVLMLLDDFYGRPGSTEQEREFARNTLRRTFQQRFDMVENLMQ